MPTMQIPEKLLPLVQEERRYKIVIGGRGSGKSMTVADISLMDAQTKGIKTACFREYQSTIDDSVLSLLTSEIERLEIQGMEVQQNRILHNGDEVFKFRGMARNPEGIKSMHGFKRFWIEEAQTNSAKSQRVLTPTLREAGSEIWMTGNPRSSADPFSQRFIKPFEKQLLKHRYYSDDLHLIIWMNYTDNPFFPDVLEHDRAYDEIHCSTAEYRHIWLGDYNDEVAGSIIPVDWFNASIDAHIKLGFKPLGAKVAAFDPSDEGGDPKGYALRHGNVYLDIAENDTGDANDGCDWACERAIKAGADVFRWDADGLGVSLKRQINQSFNGIKCEVAMFKGSEAPENPDAIYQPTEGDSRKRVKTNRETFLNNRAQKYWGIRDRFYNTFRAVRGMETGKPVYIDPDTMLSLSSEIEDIDGLRAEVCRIPKKPNNRGLIQIMSKPEMLKMEIPSPNRADSMMMAEGSPDVIAKQKVRKPQVKAVNYY